MGNCAAGLKSALTSGGKEFAGREDLKGLLSDVYQRGFRLIALGFDLTIIDRETADGWPGTAQELQQHVRPVC